MSKRTGKAVVVEGSSTTGRERLSSWRAEVAREAQNERPDGLFTGPIGIDIMFWLPKPKSAPKSKVYSDKKPDLDKLVRSTLDALTGVVFTDDAQIATMWATKKYASPDMPSGALIRIFPSARTHFPY